MEKLPCSIFVIPNGMGSKKGLRSAVLNKSPIPSFLHEVKRTIRKRNMIEYNLIIIGDVFLVLLNELVKPLLPIL